MVSGDGSALNKRELQDKPLTCIPIDMNLPAADGASDEGARKAIAACISEACGCDLSEALNVQAKHSADFMSSRFCRKGMIGAEAGKVMSI